MGNEFSRKLRKKRAYLEMKDIQSNTKKTRFLFIPSCFSFHMNTLEENGDFSKFMAPVDGVIDNINIYITECQGSNIHFEMIGVDGNGRGGFLEIPVKQGHNTYNDGTMELGGGSRIHLRLKELKFLHKIRDIYLGFTFSPSPEQFGQRIRVDRAGKALGE